MATKTPTLPQHDSTLSAIEVAMAAARARKAASVPGTPTTVIPTPADPVQAQLSKRKAQAAKKAAQAEKAHKAEVRKALFAFGWVLKQVSKHAAKAARGEALAARKAASSAGKTPTAKAQKRLVKALSTLSPEALEVFEMAKDLSAADAVALGKALIKLGTSFVSDEASEPEVTADDAEVAGETVAA